MSTTPMTDPGAATDPFASLDPRVKAILQNVLSQQQGASTLPTSGPTPLAAPPQANGSAPAPQQLQPASTPVQPSSIAAVSSPPATPQDHPGPIKSFLSNFLYGTGQGLLKHAGLPTDYEKQQDSLRNALSQQSANDNSSYRQAMTGQILNKAQEFDRQSQPYVIPNDKETFGSLAGTPTTVGNFENLSKIGFKNFGATQVQQLKNDASNYKADRTLDAATARAQYLNHGFKDVNGRAVMYDKTTGDTLKDMGPSNALVVGASNANQRAQAMARYRTFDTIDGNGFPVTISGLDALQQGAPHVGFDATKNVNSDLVGINQYKDILDNKITPNLPVLQDNTQRAIIAHTLSEADKNPGMFQSIITSAMQQGGLTPQGAQLAAGIMQGREFGGVARKYGGNMNGTEGLMNRIMANQASPLNGADLNRDLIQNDRSFTDKALTTLGGLTSHRSNVPGKTPSAPSGPPAGATHIVPGSDGKNHYTDGKNDLGVAP